MGMEAPPNTLLTYRNGSKEYVSDDVLVGKVVALFFGGNGSFCCGFVRGFSKVYKVVRKSDSDPFEVVYVSADSSRREFTRFVKTMPWLALPFRDNSNLFSRYGVPLDVRAWPRLVVVAPDNQVMFDDATPVAKMCIQEKKPEAFGTLLAGAWNEARLFRRFSVLFGGG